MPGESEDEQGLPSVSVAIATYERRPLLPKVLAPLLADRATFELVIVVDGCADGSMELLEEMAEQEPRIRPLFIERSGRSRAQQKGIDSVSGKVVLMLDDDVVADDGLVSGHARHHAQSAHLVVVGYMPPLLPAVRTPGQFATYHYANDYASMCAAYDDDPRRILLNLWGGNVSVRQADLARVPFHSDDETLYHSDRNFGLRCLKAGLTGVFDRSLRAGHLYSRSLEGYVADARIQGAGLARLHQLHPDVLGELDLVYFETGSRPWTRWVIRAARSQLVRPVVAGLLRLLVQGAGQTRRFALEGRASSLLRLVEQQRGAQELMARHFRSRVGETP